MPGEIEHRHDDQHGQGDQQAMRTGALQDPGDQHVEKKADGVDGKEPRGLSGRWPGTEAPKRVADE